MPVAATRAFCVLLWARRESRIDTSVQIPALACCAVVSLCGRASAGREVAGLAVLVAMRLLKHEPLRCLSRLQKAGEQLHICVRLSSTVSWDPLLILSVTMFWCFQACWEGEQSVGQVWFCVVLLLHFGLGEHNGEKTAKDWKLGHLA